jgi:hypothetical protein
MPDSSTAAERRRSRRKNIIASQLLTVDVALGRTATERQWQRGIVIDLSETGMAIQPFLPLAQGTVGDVRIELPGDPKPVTSTGTVAWVGQGGRAGIRFLDLHPAAREQLRQWLSRNPRGVPAQEAYFLPESAPQPEAVAAAEIDAEAELPAAEPPQESEDSEEVDFQAALQLIAERAQIITSASGAAVAIGGNTGMICRASIGAAPDVGVQLRPDSGLSGYCLRSAGIVYCPDTQADPRVDAAAARQLNLGAIIIVPVFVAGRLSGLLEVLSARPQAFDDRQVNRLERFAELLGATIDEYQRSRSPAASGPSGAQLDPGWRENAGSEGVESASAPAPAATEPEPAESVNASAEALNEPAAPPSPAFVFDATASVFPSAGLRHKSNVIGFAEPVQGEPAIPAGEPAAPTPEPPKPAEPVYLATSAGWIACKVCGHQNPPWAKLCENCHRAEDGAETAKTGEQHAYDSDMELAEPVPQEETAEPSLFSYPAAPSRPRRPRPLMLLGFILGLFTLVLLAGLAGLYAGRLRSRRALVPPPAALPVANAAPEAPAPAASPQVVPQPAPPAPPPRPAKPSPALRGGTPGVAGGKKKYTPPAHVPQTAAPKPAGPQANPAERKTMWPEKGSGSSSPTPGKTNP